MSPSSTPPGCGPRCSRTADHHGDAVVRKWKRVEGPDGARYRSSLAAHEASMLQSLVTSMLAMLEDRQTSSPADELEQITGIKAGNPRPPEDATMRRLLPDFYKPEHDHPAGL